MTLPPSDRTRATERAYQEAIRTGDIDDLLEEPAKMMLNNSWLLKVNRFPYDAKWKTSELGVLNRRMESIRDLTDQEKVELVDLIADMQEVHTQIVFNGTRRSVRDLPHFHVFNGELHRDNQALLKKFVFTFFGQDKLTKQQERWVENHE